MTIFQGWNAALLGAGGYCTGFCFANDGTVYIRTDVGGAYRFTGAIPADLNNSAKTFKQLLTFASLGTGSKLIGVSYGAYELVCAATNSAKAYGIFGNTDGTVSYRAYLSSTSGDAWTAISGIPAFANADSNPSGSPAWTRSTQGKIAVDPNNENIVYIGMPHSSGNASSVYRATDGSTFSGLSTSLIPASTFDQGTTIFFDATSGTVTDSGLGSSLTRTKRVLICVSGLGVYESLDGGVTFTEVAAATVGANMGVYDLKINADGAVYCVVFFSGAALSAGQLWRWSSYSGSKIWERLDNLAGFVAGSTYTQGYCNIIVDPRSGHQGYLTITGPQGFGVGFTSSNANNASKAAITWGGATGTEVPHNYSADVPWLSHGLANITNAFLGGTCVQIDSSGYCWWSGNQGMLWYFTTSDNATPAIPDFSVSVTTYSTSINRGTEVTVAEDILRPPGSGTLLMACQDVAVHYWDFSTNYGTDYWPNGADTYSIQTEVSRVDAFSLDFAPGNTSFVAARLTCASKVPSAQKFSSYSASSGAIGTWVPYTNQPDAFWGDTNSTNGGQICVIDDNHHIAIPGSNLAFQPCFTSDKGATAWAACVGLPSINWMLTYYVFSDQPRSRPFAAGQGANVGHAYALDVTTGAATATANIYRSTNSGANFSSFGTISGFGGTGGGNMIAPVLYSVPGFPGHLFASACFTGGSGQGVWHSTDDGATFGALSLPTMTGKNIRYMCVGKPISPSANPTVYLLLRSSTDASAQELWYTTDLGTTWNLLGSTGTSADLPANMQFYGIRSITGDWNNEGLIYASTNGAGFGYFSINAVTDHHGGKGLRNF